MLSSAGYALLTVGEADVVIQNMRPGLVERYGLDQRLREENRRLVYCNLGAFGAGGPLSDRPGAPRIAI